MQCVTGELTVLSGTSPKLGCLFILPFKITFRVISSRQQRHDESASLKPKYRVASSAKCGMKSGTNEKLESGTTLEIVSVKNFSNPGVSRDPPSKAVNNDS